MFDRIATIDLHGIPDMRTALEQLEKELFSFYSDGETHCRVIYGIGTGRMKQAVTEALQKNPMVLSYTEEETGGSCLVRL